MERNATKDQYGHSVPKDLVLLPMFSDLAVDDVEVVLAARWYESNGVLMASAAEIKGLSEDDPLDGGVKPTDPVDYVDDVLKRWNEVDGFYHA